MLATIGRNSAVVDLRTPLGRLWFEGTDKPREGNVMSFTDARRKRDPREFS